jgi:membrane associated rhomboid family serine protease
MWIILILIEIIVYLYTIIVWGLIEKGKGWSCVLYKNGSKEVYAIVDKHEYFRLINSMFLHGSGMHLAMNVGM